MLFLTDKHLLSLEKAHMGRWIIIGRWFRFMESKCGGREETEWSDWLMSPSCNNLVYPTWLENACQALVAGLRAAAVLDWVPQKQSLRQEFLQKWFFRMCFQLKLIGEQGHETGMGNKLSKVCYPAKSPGRWVWFSLTGELRRQCSHIKLSKSGVRLLKYLCSCTPPHWVRVTHVCRQSWLRHPWLKDSTGHMSALRKRDAGTSWWRWKCARRPSAQKWKGICKDVGGTLARSAAPLPGDQRSLPRTAWATSQASSPPALGFECPLEASPFLSYILVSELGCS